MAVTTRQKIIRPGYKQTDVGVIPQDWESKRLGDLFELRSGIAFSSAFFSRSGPIVLTPGNFQLDGGLYFDDGNTKRYSGPYDPSMVFNDGDLLIVMTDLTPQCNLLGKPAFVHTREVILHNQRIGKVLLRSLSIDKRYLYYVLLSRPYLARLRDLATGSTVRHTSNTSIYSVLIALPTPKEQENISEALEEVDELIDALDKLVAKKRDLKQAAMQQLLTGKRRLPGFSGKWEIKKLGEVSGIKTGKKDVNEGNPGGTYPFFTCSRESTFSDRYSFDGEAILIAGNGEVGNLHRYKGKFEAYQRTYVLQEFTINVDYLWHQLTFDFKKSLGIGTIGSSIPYIKRENIADFTFSAPVNEAERSAIATVLSDMDAELAALEQRREKALVLKRGMMQELLTGKTRLI